MKLVIAVVQDYDADRLLRAVTAAGFRATRIASMGGFLRMGNATILMCVPAADAQACLDIVAQSCRSRVEVAADTAASEFIDWYPAGIHEVTVGGAVTFTLNVSRFERILAPAPAPSRQEADE